MDWPAMSADMSPIGHIWDLGRRVRSRVPTPANVAQPSQMLIQEWNNIPQLRIQNVTQSMCRRCQACIADINNLRLLHKTFVLSNLSLHNDEI